MKVGCHTRKALFYRSFRWVTLCNSGLGHQNIGEVLRLTQIESVLSLSIRSFEVVIGPPAGLAVGVALSEYRTRQR